MPKKPAKRAPKKSAAAAEQITLKLYRRIAVGFVLVVAAILLAVIYVSTVQATIRITPVEESVKTEFILDIVKTPTSDTDVRGRVVSATLGRDQTFEPSGQGKKETEGVARGMVTLINDTGTDQPLVKTTRLLTPENVLFRIDDDVTVPANGSVEVEAYADLPGRTGDIGASSFTIPGLAVSKQEVIYAESSAPFRGGVTVTSVLSEQDIASAVNDLKKALEEEAKGMLRTEAGDVYEGETFLTKVIAEESSVEPGTETDSYDVSVTVQVVGVFYDTEALEQLAVRKLFDSLAPGHEFSGVNTDGLQVAVEKVDTEEEMANVRVHLDGKVIPSATSTSLDVGRFVGKGETEVRAMLIEDGVAEFVQVDFFPFWVKSVPRLRDHIYIEIE